MNVEGKEAEEGGTKGDGRGGEATAPRMGDRIERGPEKEKEEGQDGLWLGRPVKDGYIEVTGYGEVSVEECEKNPQLFDDVLAAIVEEGHASGSGSGERKPDEEGKGWKGDPPKTWMGYPMVNGHVEIDGYGRLSVEECKRDVEGFYRAREIGLARVAARETEQVDLSEAEKVAFYEQTKEIDTKWLEVASTKSTDGMTAATSGSGSDGREENGEEKVQVGPYVLDKKILEGLEGGDEKELQEDLVLADMTPKKEENPSEDAEEKKEERSGEKNATVVSAKAKRIQEDMLSRLKQKEKWDSSESSKASSDASLGDEDVGGKLARIKASREAREVESDGLQDTDASDGEEKAEDEDNVGPTGGPDDEGGRRPTDGGENASEEEVDKNSVGFGVQEGEEDEIRSNCNALGGSEKENAPKESAEISGAPVESNEGVEKDADEMGNGEGGGDDAVGLQEGTSDSVDYDNFKISGDESSEEGGEGDADDEGSDKEEEKEGEDGKKKLAKPPPEGFRFGPSEGPAVRQVEAVAPKVDSGGKDQTAKGTKPSGTKKKRRGGKVQRRKVELVSQGRTKTTKKKEEVDEDYVPTPKEKNVEKPNAGGKSKKKSGKAVQKSATGGRAPKKEKPRRRSMYEKHVEVWLDQGMKIDDVYFKAIPQESYLYERMVKARRLEECADWYAYRYKKNVKFSSEKDMEKFRGGCAALADIRKKYPLPDDAPLEERPKPRKTPERSPKVLVPEVRKMSAEEIGSDEAEDLSLTEDKGSKESTPRKAREPPKKKRKTSKGAQDSATEAEGEDKESLKAQIARLEKEMAELKGHKKDEDAAGEHTRGERGVENREGTVGAIGEEPVVVRGSRAHQEKMRYTGAVNWAKATFTGDRWRTIKKAEDIRGLPGGKVAYGRLVKQFPIEDKPLEPVEEVPADEGKAEEKASEERVPRRELRSETKRRENDVYLRYVTYVPPTLMLENDLPWTAREEGKEVVWPKDRPRGRFQRTTYFSDIEDSDDDDDLDKRMEVLGEQADAADGEESCSGSVEWGPREDKCLDVEIGPGEVEHGSRSARGAFRYRMRAGRPLTREEQVECSKRRLNEVLHAVLVALGDPEAEKNAPEDDDVSVQPKRKKEVTDAYWKPRRKGPYDREEDAEEKEGDDEAEDSEDESFDEDMTEASDEETDDEDKEELPLRIRGGGRESDEYEDFYEFTSDEGTMEELVLRLRGGGGGGANARKRARTKKGKALEKKILNNIKLMQRSTDFLCAKLPFKKLIKEIGDQTMRSAIGDQGATMRFKQEAVTAIQEAAENFLVDMFAEVYILALHRGAVTLQPEDLWVGQSLRGESAMSKTGKIYLKNNYRR